MPTDRPLPQKDKASRKAAASRDGVDSARVPSHHTLVEASPRTAPIRALQRVADSSTKVVQAKMKADSMAALVREQLELQGEAKANPKDYAGRYTTVGLEHEFAVMTSGPLRGVSHLELAKSTERMPYHNVPYVLETDAQNALELVSPPYLIETIAEGVAVPDPDEVEKVDAMTTATLQSHVKGELTIDTLMAGMARDPGLHFEVGNIPKKKGGAVRIARENVTPKTDERLGDKPIGKKNRELSAAELGGISLHAAGQEGGDKTATMQVNFATDVPTFHLLQELYTEAGDDYQRMYEKLEDDFRTLLYAEAFAGEVAKTKVAREGAVASFHAAADRAMLDLSRAMSVCRNPGDVDGAEKVRKGDLNYGLSSAQNSIARLQPQLNDVEARLGRPGVKATTLRASVNLLAECDAAMRRVHDTVGGGAWFLTALRGSGDGASAYVDREDAAAKQAQLPPVNTGSKELDKDDESSDDDGRSLLSKGRRPDAPWIDALPRVGEGDKDSKLALFLDLLARTLSGQLSVLAQEAVRHAQSKRFSSPGDKTLSERTLHTMVLSRVKDVHQIWLKDSILSVGLGILSPQDWERVRVMIRAGALRKALQERASVDVVVGTELVAPPKLVDSALLRVAKAISEHRLNTDKPRKVEALSPSERPALFDHDRDQIGARQDTYIPSDKVQDPGLWGDRRLHVVEVRRDSVARLREVQALLAKGKKPSVELLREVQLDAAKRPSRKKSGLPDAYGAMDDAKSSALKEPDRPGRLVGERYMLTAPQIASLTHAGRDNLNVQGDGNCLFHAVIVAGAHAGPVQALRNAVARSVASGAIDVRPFNLSPAKTAKAIRTAGSYNNSAGDATPSLIAHALGVTFIIHNENGTTTTLDGGHAATYHLIRFLRPAAHYHATQPLVAQALAQPNVQGLAHPDVVHHDDD